MVKLPYNLLRVYELRVYVSVVVYKYVLMFMM
jgi:hypothetical protein